MVLRTTGEGNVKRGRRLREESHDRVSLSTASPAIAEGETLKDREPQERHRHETRPERHRKEQGVERLRKPRGAA